MENEGRCRPVPAPRRLYPEIRKLDYENVTIDNINKNLNINSENIHNSTNCNDKLPNNKVFLGTLTDEETTTTTPHSKSILTETNDLYGPNANENVPDIAYATPSPLPRPRKPQNNENEMDNNNELYENTAQQIGRQSPRNTGAISKDTSIFNNNNSKLLRKAPELPPKTYQSLEKQKQNSEQQRAQRHSVSSEFSTTSSCNIAGTIGSLNDSTFANSWTPKSASNATLNSSIGDSGESNDNSKYKSASPGDLLKSIGTTSKLLSESIGERVAVKARGAKHKLDKNLKTSTELLSNLGSETTARLKNVSKRLGSNLNLGKKDNKSQMPEQYDSERRQTLPPNDKVFNSISFSSPLNRKATGITDLNEDDADSSYEVPRSLKVAHSDVDLIAPPSYEEALNSDNTFPRNTKGSRSLMVPKHISTEAANVALAKQRSNMSLNRVSEERSADESSRDSIDLPSPPMPSFPPPALPKEIVDSEAIYGKINAVQAPVRLKRRKNYEQIELRRTGQSPAPSVGGVSLRPNVDSAELHQMNIEAAAAEREQSLMLREQINEAEKHTPKPDRSESWEYVENDEESDSSSPEPVYANQEATYGRVFEMATSNKDLLPPQNALGSICEEVASSDRYNCLGAVGGWTQPPKNIIEEFDPLLARKSSTLCRSSKSNELLLLEHLLEQDTYGTVAGAGQCRSDDEVSVYTSEEDNINIAEAALKVELRADQEKESKAKAVVVPNAQPMKKAPEVPAVNRMTIVHQNAQLLSESMENMLDNKSTDEEQIKPYLSRVEDKPSTSGNVDLSRNAQNRTNWFVPEEQQSASQTRENPFNKLNIEDGESPPSYLEAIGVDGKPSGNEQKTRTQRFMNSMNVFSTMRIHVDALKRKASFKNAQRTSDVKVTLQMVPRPGLSPLLVRYEGPLIRFPSGVVEDILKEMQNRKAILRDRQFQTFLDQEMKVPKETIPLEHITTIQCVSNNRVTDNSTHFFCFEITTAIPKNSGSNSSTSSSSSSNIQNMSNPNLVMTSSSSGNCKHQRVAHLYGVSKESERGVWMQKLLESLTNSLPPKYACHYYRAGWCYLKHSITSEWSGTWLVLKKKQRRLIFVSDSNANVEKMDLRKARCIVLKDSDETIKNLHVESGPTLMIDCPPFTVYLVMSAPRETKIWRHIIREVAHNNGFLLSDQQLTKFNVPVIVDKCINFIYIHGSMSEGIYRKSGAENSILKLMSAFRADAFNVEITRNEYNEHDVANVLKRFMRDLPERLLGKMSDSFMCVTEIQSAAEKIPIYKELLARLGVIERETLKKIVGHLAFISSQKAKNKMSIQNLTMIWGPTLMQNHSDEMIYSQKEADVLADLIALYKNLFPLSADEVKKEQEMLLCLQKYYAAAETLTDSVKKSGDLKMWITLNPNPENTTEEKTQINVTISPTKTAYEICKELAAKMKMPTHAISLHEVILNDSLERPLHHETKVFDVVLNWSYWPEEDRKNNYLVVKPIDLLREVQRAIKNLATLTPSKELKFADNRTKSLKSYLCELRDSKIVVMKKDKNDKMTIVREIFLQSTTAYLGCEKKRDFPWSWAITFVEKTQNQILRTRFSPYIGHILAGTEWMDRTIWLSSIWYCLYGDSILPPAEIIMK